MKKFFAIVLCLIMLASLFTACGSNSDTSTTTQQGNTSQVSESTTAVEEKSVDFSNHEEFTWWSLADKYAFYSGYDNNPVVWYLNNKFNMTLKFQQPAMGTESDALSTMMATGDYTDIILIAMYRGSISQLYNDGVIVNIADYLQYMPNFKAIIDSDPMYKKNIYNDDGQILTLPTLETAQQKPWGGLVYRYDILKTMTKDNVIFPSGNDQPTTIADWDYMLPLFKKYFEDKKVKDYAPLILPYNGYFGFSDLSSGFGGYATNYLDNGVVKSGLTQDGFYNYLQKMKEWYDKGYIYKDFASRTNDPFYFPNTALTYGGAAGIWYGLTSQLGAALGPDMDVRGIQSPLDTEHGVTAAPNFQGTSKYENTGISFVITKKCKDIPRLLASLDYLYGEEGSMINSFGLDAKSAQGNPVYEKAGLKTGTWSMDQNGNFSFTPELMANKDALKEWDSLYGNRLPGLTHPDMPAPFDTPEALKAYKVWTTYPTMGIQLPGSLSRTTEEDATFVKDNSKITDYTNTTIVKFILGATSINTQTWNDYKSQLEKYGLNDIISITQASYERFNKR